MPQRRLLTAQAVEGAHRRNMCPDGGTGRHAILRGWWANACASSSLAPGTIDVRQNASQLRQNERTFCRFLFVWRRRPCPRASCGSFPTQRIPA